jgi:flagellar hook assembly protein FlgD
VKGILRGASAAVVMTVVAWGLCATPASAVGEPATTPTLTSPTDGANVSGDVGISATSTEALVQFYENGVAFGPQVATSAGAASTTWSTWGLSNGGPVVWTAADCNGAGCNPVQSTAVSVNVLNAAPTITSPLDGSTTDPFPVATATAPGGALAFAFDGAAIGIDTTAPYSEPIAGPVADGQHTLQVTECDASGVVCNGPIATSIFNVVTPTLHPAITSVAPNPFSPRVDGRNDTTSFRVHLPDAETTTWSIKNALSQTVNGPHAAGALGVGDHVFKWNGRNNANQIVADGTYTIVVETSAPSGGLTLHGTASAPVRVDDTASAVRIAAGNGATFYPVVDGYLDNFGPKATVNEGGTVWLQIYTTTGTLVSQTGLNHAAAGTFPVLWNGRNRANAIAAAGAFHFRFLTQDAAGNRSATGLGTVYLSLRHLVTKSVAITRNGNPAVVGSTDPSCTGYSTTLTKFAHGLELGNWCDENVDGPQLVVAEYTIALPGAIRYNSIRLQSLGRSDSTPQIVGGLIFNFPAGEFDLLGTSPIARSNVNLTSIYGTVPLAGRVNAARQVKVGIAVGDGPGGPLVDYDIGTVTIVVSYSVLS